MIGRYRKCQKNLSLEWNELNNYQIFSFPDNSGQNIKIKIEESSKTG